MIAVVGVAVAVAVVVDVVGAGSEIVDVLHAPDGTGPTGAAERC